jgi:hypothetical protein
MPAIVSTIAVTFAVSMGSVGVALLLLKKASVLPLEIYNQGLREPRVRNGGGDCRRSRGDHGWVKLHACAATASANYVYAHAD